MENKWVRKANKKYFGTGPTNLGSNSGPTTYQLFVIEPDVTSLIVGFVSLRISGRIKYK